jgi:hypothetical protein
MVEAPAWEIFNVPSGLVFGLELSRAIFLTAVYYCPLLWFLPIALRLGAMRSAIWIGLVFTASQITVLLLQYSPLRTGLLFPAALLAIPCIAMIGRRTRPWMAIPAAAMSAIVTRWTEGDFLTATGLVLPYAAILIFCTSLIPKKPEPTATT